MSFETSGQTRTNIRFDTTLLWKHVAKDIYTYKEIVKRYKVDEQHIESEIDEVVNQGYIHERELKFLLEPNSRNNINTMSASNICYMTDEFLKSYAYKESDLSYLKIMKKIQKLNNAYDLSTSDSFDVKKLVFEDMMEESFFRLTDNLPLPTIMYFPFGYTNINDDDYDLDAFVGLLSKLPMTDVKIHTLKSEEDNQTFKRFVDFSFTPTMVQMESIVEVQKQTSFVKSPRNVVLTQILEIDKFKKDKTPSMNP